MSLIITTRFGNLWYRFLPKEEFFVHRGWARTSAVARFINPGPFRLKEVRNPSLSASFIIGTDHDRSFKHVVATIIASTAAGGSSAVNNFAVQKVRFGPTYYNFKAVINPPT